jgi:hypothetical protein
MNIKFIPDPFGKPLYYIKLDVDESILEELKQESWVSITPTHMDDFYTKRHRIDGYLKGQEVVKVAEYLRSAEFKQILLDLVWKDMMFQHKWGPRLHYDKINDITITEFGFDKDSPGFSTDLHLENRCQIAFGKIFFMTEDREDSSSYFYSSEHRDDPTRVPTGMGLGWLCINTHWGWHEGWNKSNQDRYSSSFNFTFDMFHTGYVRKDDPTIKYIRGESDTI